MNSTKDISQNATGALLSQLLLKGTKFEELLKLQHQIILRMSVSIYFCKL